MTKEKCFKCIEKVEKEFGVVIDEHPLQPFKKEHRGKGLFICDECSAYD